MYPRFISDGPLEDALVRLTGEEARHLSRVRRVGPGEVVVLLDGTGVECEAEVVEVGRHHVTLRVLGRRQVSRESPISLTLGVALPKGDRQHFLIEKCVELGVRGVVPLVTTYGIARPTEAVLARWRRYVTEASKQCGRNQFMEIGEPQSILEFLNGCHAPPGMRWFADPACGPGDRLPAVIDGRGVVAAIGPEGGWTAEECEAAGRQGWRAVSLGPRILRTETAALAVAAWCGLR